MRVFSKLSCHILITCLAFFVNKHVQAVTDGSNQNEKTENVIEMSRSNTAKDVTIQMSSDAETYEVVFFKSFVLPYTLIESPSISKIEFEQKLDHFNNGESRTWIQRAYIDTQYEKENGPVLLRIGQLSQIYSDDLRVPYLQYLGYELHATLYILEHRYFGKSMPTEVSTENLDKFFNTDQVLADIANFIKSSDRSQKKWIVFGTGYGGMLAAWFRSKYPDVACSALVFSAPLVVIPDEKITYTIFDRLPVNGKDILKNAFVNIRNALANFQYVQLKDKFNMCTKLNEGNLDDNVNLMYWTILNHLVSVLYHNDYEMLELLLNSPIIDELDILANFIQTMMRKQQEPCLLVNYDNAIENYKKINDFRHINFPISLNLGLGILPHFYKRCMEYGHFPTTGNGSLTFGVIININFYIKFCHRIFEKEEFDLNKYRDLIENTNAIYGGRNIEVTNLLYIVPNEPSWNSVGIAVSDEYNKLITIDFDVVNENLMKNKFNLIIGKLNKWTGNTCTEDNNGGEIAVEFL